MRERTIWWVARMSGVFKMQMRIASRWFFPVSRPGSRSSWMWPTYAGSFFIPFRTSFHRYHRSKSEQRGLPVLLVARHLIKRPHKRSLLAPGMPTSARFREGGRRKKAAARDGTASKSTICCLLYSVQGDESGYVYEFTGPNLDRNV